MKEIPLTQGKMALVDDEDYEELNKVKWCANSVRHLFYAIRCGKLPDGKYKMQRMHNALMPRVIGKEIDHINGNGLDNRKENLRYVTHRENQQNNHFKKVSKYPGVFLSGKNWMARIRINGNKVYLGTFATQEEAYKKYMEAASRV